MTDDRRESGAALPTIAIMLVVLLGMTAMAVDLGWLFLNANRLQKAADASALAGVVNLPSDVAGAIGDAESAASANAYTVGIGGNASLTATPLPDNRLQVDMTTAVDTFFMSVFGFEQIEIAKTATAQYILPVRLGSNGPCFGQDPTGTKGCGANPLFWAAVSGPMTNKQQGDAFSTKFYDTSPPWNPATANPEYRSLGYFYAVEVAPGTTNFTVDLYDAGFYQRASLSDQTGDSPQDQNGGVTTTFQLFQPDDTPYDPTNNTTLAASGCSVTLAPGQQASTYELKWKKLCTVGSVTPGIYVLRVTSSGNTGGTNQFSIAASGSGPTAPLVYGLGDMSVMTNTSGTATINLAEILPVHAGKKLVIELYDAGEAYNGSLSILMPNPAEANDDLMLTDCSWTSVSDAGASGPAGSGACSITTASGGTANFHGHWLRIIVDIPGSYECTDCFWKVQYVLSGQTEPTDRTTWKAGVIGNPVRLVPNEE